MFLVVLLQPLSSVCGFGLFDIEMTDCVTSHKHPAPLSHCCWVPLFCPAEHRTGPMTLTDVDKDATWQFQTEALRPWAGFLRSTPSARRSAVLQVEASPRSWVHSSHEKDVSHGQQRNLPCFKPLRPRVSCNCSIRSPA